jgi:hypothetical protein
MHGDLMWSCLCQSNKVGCINVNGIVIKCVVLSGLLLIREHGYDGIGHNWTNPSERILKKKSMRSLAIMIMNDLNLRV